MGIKSMTGHGCSRSSSGGVSVSVEVNSVNHKQLDLRFCLPDLPASVEAESAEYIRSRVSRGFVTCRARLDYASSPDASGVIVDEALAREYVTGLRDLAGRLSLKDDLGLAVVAGMPGVVRSCSRDDSFAVGGSLLFQALKRALADMIAMRREEGAALRSDIERRLLKLGELVDKTATRAPSVVKKHARSLLGRLKASGVDINPDDPRIVREVTLFADRSDIAEEITRLRSHMGQALRKLSASVPVGRTLEFLVQEMHREINTIGSKANDAKIASNVVLFKSELERIREQVQNVE